MEHVVRAVRSDIRAKIALPVGASRSFAVLTVKSAHRMVRSDNCDTVKAMKTALATGCASLTTRRSTISLSPYVGGIYSDMHPGFLTS